MRGSLVACAVKLTAWHQPHSVREIQQPPGGELHAEAAPQSVVDVVVGVSASAASTRRRSRSFVQQGSALEPCVNDASRAAVSPARGAKRATCTPHPQSQSQSQQAQVRSMTISQSRSPRTGHQLS